MEEAFAVTRTISQYDLMCNHWGSEKHNEYMRMLKAGMMREAGEKVMERLEDGKMHVFCAGWASTTDGPERPYLMHYALVLRMNTVETMQVRMYEPIPIDQMRWASLSKTACGEIARRLKRKLFFWRR